MKNNKLSDRQEINVKHYKVKILKRSSNPFKFIVSVVSYAIFVLLLLIGVSLLIYIADIKLRNSKGDFSPPKYNAYVVMTGSMLPKIRVNDVVLTKKVDAKDLNVGDVITFISSDKRFEGITVTHRVLERYYDPNTDTYSFRTKGDANNVPDSALAQDYNILGKVILKIPLLGFLKEFLATRGGWIIVILIPSLIVLSYDIMKLLKAMKRKTIQVKRSNNFHKSKNKIGKM